MQLKQLAVVQRMLRVLVLALALTLGSCDNRAFRQAEKENTIQAFEKYLQKYPHGKHQQAANGHLAQLHFQEASRVRTVESYREYLRRYPTSVVAPVARQTLNELVDVEIKTLTDSQIEKMRALLQTDFGTIKLKFFPQKAPNTCRNFIKLARSLFYDNSQFVLIVPGVLVQGGAPTGDPRGGPGYFIKREINDLPNQTGSVGMVRWEHPDSAGSQFYICLRRLAQRDGQYTVFAQVEEGIEVVEALSDQENTGPDGEPYPWKPLKPLYIRSVEIQGFDAEP